MIWTRRGCLLTVVPEGWWHSHAQAPTPLVLGPRHWRLYFGGRGRDNRAQILFVDVDPADDFRVLDLCRVPVLDLGPPGSFDSAGQNASTALLRNGEVHLYYTGMHLRRDVPYGMGVGLAVSADGRQFRRLVPGPVLGTGPMDPQCSSVAHVLDRPEGSVAWYTSIAGWVTGSDGEVDPVYGLASAVSSDGIFWRRRAAEVPHDDTHMGLARPCLTRVGGAPVLFYARRGGQGFRSDPAKAYRLVSQPLAEDGTPLAPAEELRFANPPRPGEGDDFMQTYPSVMPLGGGHVLFYNGNGFGAGGIFWATSGL